MSFIRMLIAVLSLATSAAAEEACAVLSPQEVAKAIGAGDMTLMVQTTKAYTGEQYNLSKGMGGVSVALCIYTTAGSTTTATVRVHSFESAAAAQEFMKRSGDIKNGPSPTPGDVAEPDKLGSVPAIFQRIHGNGSMMIGKGAKVISAGVAYRPAQTPLDRERSRSLLAAELAKF
jgi:hypothetical protein